MEITEHLFKTPRHETFYLAAGNLDDPLIYLIHGWPDLSIGWMKQISYLANLGYRVIAPDMRGYGRSTIHQNHSDYCQKEIVKDMLELHLSFKKEKAIWIGHDWGSVVVWNMGLHHQDNVEALGSLCVPFGWGGHPDSYLDHIDRTLYPEDKYPYGQWDYMYFYYENFDLACKQMAEDPHKMIKLNFTKPSEEFKGCFNAGIGAKSMTASIRSNGGWFKHYGFDGLNSIPDVPVDKDLISEKEAATYGNFLEKNGFFGPNSWYVNGQLNDQFAKELQQFTTIDCPVLFIQATYDSVLTRNFNTHNKMVCTNLTEREVDSGHWMAREKPNETNQIIKKWLEELKN